MDYSTFVPNKNLLSIIECYWLVEGSDQEWQKITPDGRPEMIFHFADPYKIRITNDEAVLQPFCLVSGQLTQPIYLQPTGTSGVFGVKFKPNGLWKFLGCDMSILLNQVVNLNQLWKRDTASVLKFLAENADVKVKVKCIDDFLGSHQIVHSGGGVLDEVIEGIIKQKGQVTVSELAKKHGIHPRTMERMFQQQAGVSIKMFCRIIRFTSVFKLMQQPSLSRTDALYLSGYFDQPHFNREFREFTGENPQRYFSNNHHFSNFFLNR